MTVWRLELESARGAAGARAVDRDLLVVGRGQECDLQVADLRVSRQHCRFERRGDELYVVDLGSRRGTRVNGRTIDRPLRLAPGDVVELSEESRLLVAAGAEPEPPSTASFDSDSTGAIFRDAASLLVPADAVAAARSEAELRHTAERLHLLNEIHQALAESPSRDVLLELILDRVFRQLRPEQAAVLLLSPAGELVHAVTRPPGLAGDQLFYSRSLAREVTTRRVAALVLDAPTDVRFAAAASILSSGVKSVLAAPLLVPDGALGMIVLSSRVQVRQFGEQDMELLVSLASVAALHLRNLALTEEAAERRRLEQELTLARRIQIALLPAHLPAVPGYELLAGNVPSRGVSGDLYTVSLHPESGAATCFVADVSGKGMAASLLGASLEALAAGPIEVDHPPDGICVRVSRRLHQRTPPEKYATAFVARLEPGAHRLAWTNAGHNPALLVRGDGRIERLAATGPPLGLLANASYRALATELAPGDLLLVYTDGITEACDPEEQEFGLEPLEALATRHRGAPLDELRDAIDDALDAHAQGVPFADDRTMLFLRRATS